jgi:Transposase DDE domain
VWRGGKVVVKAQTGGDCIQNPSDPDATYDGKKGPGYQVQIAETCVPSNDVQLITAALPQTACESDAQAVTPMLDQLETAGRLPEELLADTLDTGDENVLAAAARGVDLVGPVPGRAPEADPETLTVDDFALDERTGMIDACPAGHLPTSCSQDTETATTRVEMPASACAECPFRKQCPIKNTRDGKFTLEFTDKERRLAGRRVEEATDVFAERYAPRSGIESTHSGLKNRLDLGHLSVRGLKSVSRVLLHKLAGWNVLRASASQKLKTWVASRVAETLGTSDPGRSAGLFDHLGRLMGRDVRVLWRVVRPDQCPEPMLAAGTNPGIPHKLSSVGDVRSGHS